MLGREGGGTLEQSGRMPRVTCASKCSNTYIHLKGVRRAAVKMREDEGPRDYMKKNDMA
jgi:hypothetical protein